MVTIDRVMKVMLVEDDMEWSNGLRSFFSTEPTLEIVSCVDSKEACLSALSIATVDIILMDIMLNDPAATGLDITLDITYKYPSIKVIILSSIMNEDEVFNEAFLNGRQRACWNCNWQKRWNACAEG